MERLGDFLKEKRHFILLVAPALISALFLLITLPVLQYSIQEKELENLGLSEGIFPQLLTAWKSFVGKSDFGIRFFSTSCIALSLLILFMDLKYRFGLTVACLVSFLLAFAPPLVHFGALISNEAWNILLATSSHFLLDLILYNKKWYWILLYIACIVLGFLSTPIFGIIFILHIIYSKINLGQDFYHPKIAIVTITAGVALLVCAFFNSVPELQSAERTILSLLYIILTTSISIILIKKTRHAQEPKTKRHIRIYSLGIIILITVLQGLGLLTIFSIQNRDSLNGRIPLTKKFYSEIEELTNNNTREIYSDEELLTELSFYDEQNKIQSINKLASQNEYWLVQRASQSPKPNHTCPKIISNYKSSLDDGTDSAYYALLCRQ